MYVYVKNFAVVMCYLEGQVHSKVYKWVVDDFAVDMKVDKRKDYLKNTVIEED